MEERCGPYTLLRKIASGGMADVYLARAPSSRGEEGLVALKMVAAQFACDEEFIDSLKEEAALSVRLRHPNIASIFDLGRVDDVLYLPMELVDGKNVFELLIRADRDERFLPVAAAAWIARETAAALHYAHSLLDLAGRALNIIHRDISPQNILLSWSGDVKLCDFGIAKAATRASRTRAGVIKGKFSYMSPEQARGLLLDQRTDIFSLGICLWEMVCGEMLYQHEDTTELLRAVRAVRIPTPSSRRDDLPPALETIILRALEPDPNDRYESAQQLVEALDRYLQHQAPDFSAHDLAKLMRSCFPEITPEPSIAPSGGQERSSAAAPPIETAADNPSFTPGPTQQLEVLRAEDFTPDLDHSVIFSADDLAAQAKSHLNRRAEQDLGMADDPKDSAPGPEATRMLQSDELLEQLEADDQAADDTPPRDELDPTLPPGAISVAEVEAHLAALQEKDEGGDGGASGLSGATMMLDMREIADEVAAEPVDESKLSTVPLDTEPAAEEGSGLAAATVMLNARDLEKMMQEQGGEEAASPLAAPPEEEAPDPAYAQKTAFMSRDDPAIAAALEQAQALASQGEAAALPETVAAQPAPIAEQAPSPAEAPKKTGIKVKKKGVKVVRVGKASAVKAEPAPEEKVEQPAAQPASAEQAKSPAAEEPAPKPKATPAAKEEAASEAEVPTEPAKKAEAKKKPAKKKGAKKKGAKKKSAKAAGPPPSKMGRVASTKTASKFEPAVILTFVGILLFGGLSLNYALALMWVDYGTLKISSEPTGAAISLDGKELNEKTPHTVKGLLVDQPHSVTLSLKGYIDEIEEDIIVSGDQETRNHYELRPVPGSLEISSRPKGAQVYIDGEMRCPRTPCTVHDLPRDQDLPVTFKLRRYQDKTQVHVWMSKEDSISVRLERRRRRR